MLGVDGAYTFCGLQVQDFAFQRGDFLVLLMHLLFPLFLVGPDAGVVVIAGFVVIDGREFFVSFRDRAQNISRFVGVRRIETHGDDVFIACGRGGNALANRDQIIATRADGVQGNQTLGLAFAQNSDRVDMNFPGVIEQFGLGVEIRLHVHAFANHFGAGRFHNDLAGACVNLGPRFSIQPECEPAGSYNQKDQPATVPDRL